MEARPQIPHYFPQHVLQERQFGKELNFKLNVVEKFPQGMCLAPFAFPLLPNIHPAANFFANKMVTFYR